MKNKRAKGVLIAASILFSTLGWAFVFRSLYFADGLFWSLPLAAFFLMLVFFSVLLVADQNRKHAYFIIILINLPAFLAAKSSWLLMLPIVAFGNLLFFHGAANIWRERSNRLTIDIGQLIKFGMPVIVTAMALMISANYLFSIKDQIQLGNPPRFPIVIPQSLISAGIRLSGVIFPREEVAAIMQGATVDEFIEKSVQGSSNEEMQAETEALLESQLGRKLTEQEKQQLIKQLNSSEDGDLAKEMVRRKLSEQFNTELTGREEMRVVINNFVNTEVEAFFNKGRGGKQILPFGMAVALFLTVKTLGWVLIYPLSWTTKLVSHIMIKMKVLQVIKVKKEAEELV